MSTVEEILAQGTRLHQAGRLAEAERAYRQILASDPRHPHALHQLGMLAMQARQFPAAVELISQAVRSDRTQAAFYANLGEAYRHSGKLPEALETYRKSLQVNPNLAQVHLLLGSLLEQMGRGEEAAASFREALRIQPEDAEARSRLGLLLEAQGKLNEAEACLRRVLRTVDTTEAHFNLASVLQGQGRDEEAVAEYEAALARTPGHVESHNNLGTVLNRLNRWDDAERHFQAVLTAQPQFVPAHVNLALVRQNQKRYDEAVELYRRALELEPNTVPALYGLGTALDKLSKSSEAEKCFERLLALVPSYADAHLSLANLLQRTRRYGKAIEHCEAALRVQPDLALAHSNLCVAFAGQGRQDEAVASARRAVELDPALAHAHGNLGIALQVLGLLDEAIAAQRKAVQLDPESSGRYSNLLYSMNYHPAIDAQTLFAEHRAWGELHADPLLAQSPPHTNDRSTERRLRIGYVSPNFYAQAVNFFTEPILASHDHERFEVFCYSDVVEPDEVTARLQGYADHWLDTRSLGDDELAERIRADRIDILVDLTGHIGGGSRMLLFARKPAPVQVTYIGYQNTTGMQAMDYRLTDDYSDPPGTTDALHTEKLERLPTTFFCYKPSDYAPPVGTLPAEKNGYITFGSVNAFCKITQHVLDAWAGILRRVADSHLMIRADMTESLRTRLRETFAQQGIAADRLELVNRLPRPKYLELIARVDVALDPFPFNGHTTTCDCLWQGVPVVTLSGDTYVSRFGGSGLVTLGLNELITQSVPEYIDAAVSLAQDRQRLADYRATLRERMANSPLLDFETFTRNLEKSYRRMWADWCAQGQ